jgi:hypothetical protein
LFDVTKELLILETAILPLERTPESFVDIPAGGEATLHPLVYAENLPEKKEHVFNWFLPSINALRALLSNVGFDEIEVVDTKRDRAIVLCKKAKPTAGGRVLSQLNARVTLKKGPRACSVGSKVKFGLLAENTGGTRWEKHSAEGERGIVRLGAHLLQMNGEELVWDYGRAALAHDVEPGQDAFIWIELTAPETPGRYLIEFDMVLEHFTWFEDLGAVTARTELVVHRNLWIKAFASLLRVSAAHQDSILWLRRATQQRVVRESCREWAPETHQSHVA